MSDKMSIETVYGTTNEESHVMSEKVQTLAGTVYKEFEKVIKRYDEDVVKDLMPLVVGILETLDAAFTEKQELDVEIELLREDNEQLLTQYEREKQLRKSSEQKYLEMEDNIEGVRKELEDKVETLESILRMSEIKSKNSADHVSRLEEKEHESKTEYNKLHERYTELFRTHMDYMERTKILMGTDKLSELTGMTPRITKGGFSLPGLRPVSVAYGAALEYQRHESSPMSYDTGTPQSSNSVSLKSELDAQTPKKGDLANDKEQFADNINMAEKATGTTTTPELEESHNTLGSPSSLCKRKSLHNDNSIFDELQSTDIAEVDFGADITDSDKEEEEEAEDVRDNDRDSVGDNFFGMGKELDNLIMENTELLATKNALNIVKDDLIAKVDELSSEQELLREEIASLQAVKNKLQQRLAMMEEELKKVREENEKKEKEQTEKGEEEDDVPMAQRKRFTRVEMARVLMERNQYKERLMELQEAVRWTEMIRASREHPGELQTKKKSSVWNFFSELVAPLQPAQTPFNPAQKQIPERHQNVLQAVINSSHNHMSLSTVTDILPALTSVTLLPSPTSSSLSRLANITLLPPHENSTTPTSAPLPVVLSAHLMNLLPTPSDITSPANIPQPLTGASASHIPKPLSQSSIVSTPSSQSHGPTIPKPQRVTSALPGIQLEPDHPVKHL